MRLETTSTVVIRVKDKALRTSYFLYRTHVNFSERVPILSIIPFLNDSISLAKTAFVVAQFIAPLTFKMSYTSVSVFYFSELVLLLDVPAIVKLVTFSVKVFM